MRATAARGGARTKIGSGFALLVAAGVTLASVKAEADPSARPIVIWGEGAAGEEVASRLELRLNASYEARDPGSFRSALAPSALFLASAARDRVKDRKLVVRARAAARSAHVEAAVLVSVRKSKRGTAVHVWLIDAQGDGAAVDREVALPAGASALEEANAAWNAVSAALAPSAATTAPPAPSPAAPAPAPAPEPAAESAPASPPASAPTPTTEERPAATEAAGGPTNENKRATRANALLFARVLLEAGSRHFSYTDRVTTTLRSYDLLAAPLVAAEAEVYPLARTALPVLKDLGLTFDYRIAFALSSADDAGTAVSTAWSSFDVGARERIHLSRAVVLGVRGGYGQNAFSFNASLPTTAELPDVQYHFVAGGVDATLTVGSLSLYVAGSYLGVLSAGREGTYFPRATVGGLAGTLGASYVLGDGFEVSLEVAYTRFFYSMNPEPGDPYVAGGALDQMGRGSLGVAYVF